MADVKVYMELSPAQQNIYDIMMAYPNVPIANVGGLIWLKGEIKYEHMQWCTNEICKKYSTLRMRFAENKKLYIKEYTPEPLREFDLTELNEEEFRQRIQEWFCRIFPLCDSPLYEILLIRWKGHSLLFGRFHHLILDGTAILNTLREYESWYEKDENDTEYLPDNRFEEYLIQRKWEKPLLFERAAAYFEKEFGDLAVNWRIKDYLASQKSNIKARRRKIILGGELTGKLRTFALHKNLTVESIICGVLYCYIREVKSAGKAVIGRGMINRSKEELSMLSMMTNMLPLLIEGSEEDNFSSLCKNIKSRLFSLMRYASYGYHEMKQRLNRPEQLFDIAVSYRMSRLLPNVGNGKSEEFFNGYSEIPLRLFIEDDIEQIQLVFQYQTVCYGEWEIEALTENLLHILEQALEDKCLCKIDILGKKEKEWIMEYNHSESPQFKETVFDKFRQQTKRVPKRIIWMEENKSVTFEEAAKIVDKITARLLKWNIGKGDVVALKLRRTHLLPAAMLACMQIGAAFFPLSVKESAERMPQLIEGCQLILTDEWLTKAVSGREKKEGEKIPFFISKPSDPAYYISTSGSTGNPKIAILTQEGLALRLVWMRDYLKSNGLFHLNPITILQKTVNTFDVSVWELLFPAAYGQSLFLLADGEEKYPDRIAEVLVEHKIGLVHFVPSMLAVFLDYIQNRKISLPDLKIVIASGEALTPELVRQFYRTLKDARLHNFYGPAECTIDVCAGVCQPEDTLVTLGYPAYGTELYVVNEKLSLLPRGSEGELLIVGKLVGKGYWNKEAEQNKRFIEWNGKPAYRSRDRVKADEDGRLLYLGRLNQEAKLRGMRIDLSEIELQMCLCSGAKQASAQVIDNKLLAFYTAENVIEDWWERLRKVLPSYAVPVRFIHLSKMPMHANGKIDKNALKEALPKEVKIDAEGGEFQGEKELIFARLTAPYLKGVSFGPEDNLLKLGLDSLSIVSIIIDLEKEGIAVTFPDFYQMPQIRALARSVGCKEFNRNEKGSKGLWGFLEDGRICPFNVPHGKAEHLLLCIPYAGAEPSMFISLAKHMQKYGFVTAAVDLYYYKNLSVQAMAEDIQKKLPVYGTLTLLGCCVGSALAVELAGRMKHICLFLCEAIPRTYLHLGKKKLLIWDCLNAAQTDRLLTLLAGKRIRTTKKQRRQLKWDAKKSADYFEDVRIKARGIPTVFLYGTKDLLTLHYKKRYHLFDRYLRTKSRLYSIEGAKHFLVDSCSHVIAPILLENLKDNRKRE